MKFIDPLGWKLKRFIVREVTHAHKGGAVSLAPYHHDIKTFQWTRLLSSWFCLSWHSVVRDLLCKTIGEEHWLWLREYKAVWGFFPLRDHEACLLWFAVTHSLMCSFIYGVAKQPSENLLHPSPWDILSHLHIFNSSYLNQPLLDMSHHLTYNFLPKNFAFH